MRKLHEKGFPVPKPLYLSTDEDDEYFDTVFFIREYVEVCAMDNCIKPLLYIIRMYTVPLIRILSTVGTFVTHQFCIHAFKYVQLC